MRKWPCSITRKTDSCWWLLIFKSDGIVNCIILTFRRRAVIIFLWRILTLVCILSLKLSVKTITAGRQLESIFNSPWSWPCWPSVPSTDDTLQESCQWTHWQHKSSLWYWIFFKYLCWCHHLIARLHRQNQISPWDWLCSRRCMHWNGKTLQICYGYWYWWRND